ncbi:2-amino-4-hydroxy-6-hydroxymethyldihydropteridine diphosphokinase [Scopulibacillus darangshiensis]|uniref:2-amino-4-hydroxy-6-hydroxymethyldihydropteridine diphosphokinase n=1 Tax=Scopulibacillus darangshiensis TaxID=442528 RepID=A0A4R2N9Q6_9BACL|nr:2-amino-4-hydroxy-6-hydroxymethyldihydropteridine diphosphokinase [Scopulibacillus darangshiensis]TCP17767.1 2-amino-4-hydroxy-6-hydroxymethyldihydropteridine diphosphokinase [Scopulibacillus darangshiensis]
MELRTAYIGMGSNVGDRDQYLKKALEKIEQTNGIMVRSCSSIYETVPYGPVKQNDFLNMVANVQTVMSPDELLQTLQAIERSLDRKREIHWGPRTIDLDILLYDHENIVMEHLKIPHPEISKRLFVVKPLKEIYPELIMPDTSQSLKTIYERLKDEEGVRLWKENNGEGEFGLFEN